MIPHNVLTRKESLPACGMVCVLVYRSCISTKTFLWMKSFQSWQQGMDLRLSKNALLPEKGALLIVLSARQYRFALKRWKITKNIPSIVMKSAARKLHENPQRHDFEYKKSTISILDIRRFQARHSSFDPAASPTACKLVFPAAR